MSPLAPVFAFLGIEIAIWCVFKTIYGRGNWGTIYANLSLALTNLVFTLGLQVLLIVVKVSR